jgi:lysine 2,3-aminomutase
MFMSNYFAKLSKKDWNDWHWHLNHKITTIQELTKIVDLTPKEIEDLDKVSLKFRWAISPYYASLMDKTDKNCPIRKQAVPSIKKLDDKVGVDDPKKEEKSLPVDCLFQVYPDRLVLYLTNCCPSFCRHCFRRRRIGKTDRATSKKEIDRAVVYLKTAKKNRDVLVTGGDAFMVPDEMIEYVLKSLRKIPHIEIIRFGTRTLCALPQRITPRLADIIAKYHPVWVNTQFNHPREITKETTRTCDILLSRGIPLGNQTVLLRGINDNAETMTKLMHELLKIRVRPYYIFHCFYQNWQNSP